TVANGDLVVGGDFTTAGSVLANHVARWTGNGGGVWSSLVSGTDNCVSALASRPGGNLAAGGLFTYFGYFNVSEYFARYSFGSTAPSINIQPRPQSVCPSGAAMFS